MRFYLYTFFILLCVLFLGTTVTAQFGQRQGCFLTTECDTPPISPTPTAPERPLNAFTCQCTASNTCDASCTFEKLSNITYPASINCNNPALAQDPPTSTEKDQYCLRPLRTQGDTDGNGKVEMTDYYYFLRSSLQALVPRTVNSDLNGDGTVSPDDKNIIITQLQITPSPTTPVTPTSSPAVTITDGPSPTSGTADIQSLINTISSTNLQSYIQNLAPDTGTRYSFSNRSSVDYIKSKMEEFGLEEVALHNFTIQGTTVYNIMGRIYGQNRNEFYLLTAHMDSTAQRSGVNNPAPGADDNGSGTITVLESCRALKTISAQLKKSVICILFNGEELGLLGSKAYVNSLSAAELQKIKGVINMDMVGYAQGESGECVKFGYKDYNGGNILSEKVVSAVNRYAIGLQTGSISTDISASDHAPFWNKGVPAIFASECDLMVYKRGEIYPGYHSVGDKINLISIPQITKVAKAVTAAVAELALTQ